MSKVVGNCPRCGNPIYEEWDVSDPNSTAQMSSQRRIIRTCSCVFHTGPDRIYAGDVDEVPSYPYTTSITW